ncbi:ABC transporter substrate-binding protein [Amorphus sp. 3PC139-8]|uniref:ABC transporter substrate-binding protein n=1 Tax=Amorphus sp. 3PC139-8 TaxID=2735676 RepID=UPI00345CD317
MTTSLTRRAFNLGLMGAGAAAATAGTLGFPRPARAMSELTFQAIWLNDPEFLGYMIAIENGLYEKAGLKVNYLPGGPNLVPVGSLLSGKSDIALTNMLSVGKAVVEKGAPFKVIGTQYQKSPMGFISLEGTGIKGPKDLVGKTLAVSTLASSSVAAFLKLNEISKDEVKIVPYTFNPSALINGEVDAVVDFVTQTPFLVEQASGKKAAYFLLYDYGLEFYIDLITVSEETLANRRDDLIAFLKASKEGWAENFKDPEKYVKAYHDTWFKGTGSTIEAELYFNKVQEDLMMHPDGLYTMTEEGIERNIKSLALLGVDASPDLFDTSVLKEL